VVGREAFVARDRRCCEGYSVSAHRQENERILADSRNPEVKVNGIYRNSAMAEYGALAILLNG